MKIHPCVTYQLKKPFLRLKPVLFIVLVTTGAVTYGQKRQVITGTVKDMEDKPVPLAHVELLTLKLNQIIQKATTDSVGMFLLDFHTSDSVFVRISSLGYASFQSAPFKISSDENYIIGDIRLEYDKVKLDEVVVSTTPPEVIQKADRTIVNLEGNILASGSNMLEIMSRLPGVFVDKDGNITFNSKTNILLTINGRQTYMEPGDLATYLKGQPAENLKNVELFSNSPASYDAAGTGGVINLNLKNVGEDGLNGSVTAGTRYNGGWSYTSAANLNYKTGKWQTRLGLSRNDYFHTEDMEIYKEFNETALSPRSLFSQDIDWDVRTKTFLLDATIDYAIKDGHRVGVSYQLSDENRKDFRNAITDIEEISRPISREHAVIDDVSPGTRHSVDVFYVGDLDTLGSNISADFIYIHSDKDFQSLLTMPQTIGSAVLPDGSLETLNPVLYEVYGGQVDLTKVTRSGRSFKAGLKYSTVKSDNNLIMNVWQDDSWNLDTDNSNWFLYDENITAAYGSYHTSLGKKRTLDVGLRLEHTDMRGRSRTTGEKNKRDYLNLFPSISLEQSISDNYRIAYNYNRRITRPNYRLLNPYRRYLNEYNVQIGNPMIRPMYSDNFEINNIIHDKYQLALTYSRTSDVFGIVLEQDDRSRVTTVQMRNLDMQKNTGIRFNAPITFTKWWSSENSATINRISYNSIIDETSIDQHQASYSIQTQHSFNLPADIKFQVSGTFFGPQLFGIYTLDPLYWIDTGVQKSFFRNKLTASINFNDIFRTQIYSNLLNFRNINSTESGYYATRMVMVSLKYSFSRGKDFSLNKPDVDQEETNRMAQ